MGLMLLLILLLVMSCVAFVFCNGDALEPLALSCESFALSTFIAFCYNKFSIADISMTTIIIVLSALLIYMIGYLLVKAVMQGKIVGNYSATVKIFKIPTKSFSFVCFISEIIISFLVFNSTMSIARMVNSSANISNMLEYSRNAYLFTDAGMGTALSIGSFFVLALGYFYTYVLVYCIVGQGQKMNDILKNKKLECAIVILSLLSAMLGTGRTFLIKYIVFLFITIYYTRFLRYKIKRVSFHELLGTLKKMIIALVVFFILFQLMGILTNKTGKLSVGDMLYGYSGASIIALDRSIESFSKDGRFFGEESFYGLYGFLNALGLNIPNDILHLPFVDIGNGQRTNIYTSLRTYLYDFGYVGLYIVQFLLGAVSAMMYSLMYRFRMHPIYLMIYGILVYGTAMQGIAETTLRNFMSITNVFLSAFFVLLYGVTQQRKVRIRWTRR